MRVVLLRSAVLLILVAMLGGHITELFDRWDHTMQTGSDIDYSVVSIAACAGFALLAAMGAVRLLRRPPKIESSKVERPIPVFYGFVPDVSAAITPSPPPLLPLRI